MINNKSKHWNNLIIGSFLAVPIFCSFISTLHLVHFFNLGNPDWMSYFLAIVFEIGSVASFVALSVLDKIKKGMVMFIFTILFVLQLVGNIFFSFQYINLQLAVDPAWMNTFIELSKPLFDVEDPSTYKFILSLLIGVPIPLVSLLFLKSLVDYLKVDEKQIAEQPIISEPEKVEEKQAVDSKDVMNFLSKMMKYDTDKKEEQPESTGIIREIELEKRKKDDSIAPFAVHGG